MRKKLLTLTALTMGLVLAVGVSMVQASPIFWTDWTNTSSSTVLGALNVNGNSVGVTFSGPYSFRFSQTNGGINYWNPSAPYLSTTVDNAPPNSDIIALNVGGTKTITFSQEVQNPVLALVSWNHNTVDFGVPIEVLSYGTGYWGYGTPVLNASGTGFYGNGEFHGVIRLPGRYTQITFTDSTECWHGLTVGVASLPPSPVPEPASMLLLGTGLAGLAGLNVIRKKKRVHYAFV